MIKESHMKKNGIAKGVIGLLGSTVKQAHHKEGVEKFFFSVKNEQRNYLIYSNSVDETDEWVFIIQKVCLFISQKL